MPQPPVRFFVATTNAGKLRDFEFAAAGAGVELTPLPGLAAIAPPDEDAPDFAGNAALKAIYYSRFAAGEIVLADDSGLEVDALRGAPGVRSARYAEDCGFTGDAEATVDARNNACLLAAMRGVGAGARGARYRCVLAAARDGIVIATGSGCVEGRILTAAQGGGGFGHGFGYDPYFVPEDEGRSMAELEPARRMLVSHRGRALADLMRRIFDFAQLSR